MYIRQFGAILNHKMMRMWAQAYLLARGITASDSISDRDAHMFEDDRLIEHHAAVRAANRFVSTLFKELL